MASADTLADRGYVHIAVFDAREGWPPAKPIDYHAIRSDRLRDVLSVAAEDHVMALQVGDDTMAPTIGAEDRVLIDCSSTSVATPGLYAFDADGVVVIKRACRKFETGELVLVCDNPRYPAQVVGDTDELSPIGRVFLSIVRF